MAKKFRIVKNYKEENKIILETTKQEPNLIKILVDTDWKKLSLKKKDGLNGEIIVCVKMKRKK